MTEAILEPDLVIIDPHHHLWDLRPLLAVFPEPRHPFIESLVDAAYYTFDQFRADATSGHNIVASVFVECGAFYIGALGSRRTHEKRILRLREIGYEQAVIDRIKAPIGMFGPARHATSLAISILADVAVAREKTLGH